MTEELLENEETMTAENEAAEEAAEVAEAAAPAEDAPAAPAVPLEEALEAVLFAAGHSVSYATLARVFQLTPGKVKERVRAYAKEYNDCAFPRGVIMLCYDDACQLCTKEVFLPEIREVLGIKKSGSLSTSSMEALAIIAYNQPCTRFFVDTLRRADSSYAMTNLLDRGLIECKGRLDVPGRPYLYGTTDDFLRCFGLPSIASLPKATEDLMDMFVKAREQTDAENDEIEGATQIAIAPDMMSLNESTSEETTEETAGENAEEVQAAETVTLDEEPSAEDF